MAGVYVPRSPTSGVLYAVVRTHLADFLAAVDARTDGSGLPPFVTAEFRKFLRCGVLAHGFARVRCRDCAFERLALLYHEVLAPNARWRGGGARRGGEHGSPSRGVRDTGRRSRVR